MTAQLPEKVPSTAPVAASANTVEAPWWTSKTLVATVTATLAAVLPLATFIQVSVHERSEASLAAQKYDNELKAKSRERQDAIRLSYFEKAIDPSRPPTLRLSVLRFLAQANAIDDDVKRWATAEIQPVTDLIEAEVRADKSAVRSAATELNETVEQVSELERKNADAKTIEVQTKRVDTQNVRIAEAEARLRVAQQLVLPSAVATCKSGSMRSSLRSGIDEKVGSTVT